jgi:anti-sigma B factor antagonist
MKIVNKIQADCSICDVDGEINLNTSLELRKVFDELVRSQIKKVIIDFSKVPYIDSSGLATLIELLQRLKKNNGKLRICSVTEKVKNIFEITKLHKLFEIYDDQESALESF